MENIVCMMKKKRKKKKERKEVRKKFIYFLVGCLNEKSVSVDFIIILY